jgi:hypothetical protein
LYNIDKETGASDTYKALAGYNRERRKPKKMLTVEEEPRDCECYETDS